MEIFNIIGGMCGLLAIIINIINIIQTKSFSIEKYAAKKERKIANANKKLERKYGAW